MSNIEMWNENGDLIPLEYINYDGDNSKDVAIVIVNRDRPDLTDQLVEQIETVKGNLTVDVFVAEMGSTKKSKYSSIWYEDKDYRGKAYGHNVGLRYAKTQGKYRYYFIAMNDIIFQTELGLEKLVEIADSNPQLAILSPTETDSGYAGGICKPIKGRDYHLVSQCNYLGLLMRSECVDEIGFLNPDFKYCWGAIHELSYKLYLEGYEVAYCDAVQMKHFGGTTYGKVKNTIPREEYLKNARTFAARYMVANYGKQWDKEFTKALPESVNGRFNTYTMHKGRWERALESHERKLYNTNTDDEISALNPWYYPVVIGDRVVRPGIGSKQSPTSLIERAKYRKKLLVDEVRRRYDFKDKSILDVASNCAYWSSFYVEIGGAKSVTAIEGRLDYVKQGYLYWNTNKFTDNFQFIHDNVLNQMLWDLLYQRSFDFTLCAGILYHIEHYDNLLNHICTVTKEAILIDTRVSPDNRLVEEPGGFCFDAIEETSKKRIPSLENIRSILINRGFKNIEQIKINTPLPKGMGSHDNYDTGRRICLLCQK